MPAPSTAMSSRAYDSRAYAPHAHFPGSRRPPASSISVRGRESNATFATPLTAERALMDRIRTKLERTQGRLASEHARSSMRADEARSQIQSMNPHYFPPDYASRRGPAAPVPSVRLEDLALSSSAVSISSSRVRSRYADENRRPTQPPVYQYQSSTLRPPPSSSSFVVYSSSRGSIPMDEWFPPSSSTSHAAPCSTRPMQMQPKSIMRSGRSQRWTMGPSQSAGEDAAPPSSRVRFQESRPKPQFETQVSIEPPPVVEEEDEDERDSWAEPVKPAPRPKPAAPVAKPKAPIVEVSRPQAPIPQPTQPIALVPKPKSPTAASPKPQQKPKAQSPTATTAAAAASPRSPVAAARPKPRQSLEEPRRSSVAEPPKSAIKISAFDKFFGSSFWHPKSRRGKVKGKDQPQEPPTTRISLPQSPVAVRTPTAVPFAAETAETACKTVNPTEKTETPAKTSEPAAATAHTAKPATNLKEKPREDVVKSSLPPRPMVSLPLERISEASSRSSIAILTPADITETTVDQEPALMLSPRTVHAENASTLVVLDTEEDNATFLSADEYIPSSGISSGIPSFEPTSGTNDSTFVLPRRSLSIDDPDIDDPEIDDYYGDYEPPINSTTSSCLSDDCIPPHLAHLLQGNEPASYVTDDEHWPSSLESISHESGQDAGTTSASDKKPPPSSLSNDLEYLLALARACQDEYASSNRDSMLSSCSEPSDVYSSTNSFSMLPSPPPSTRERALSDEPPMSSHLPRARPVVTSTIQRMNTRERWIDDEPDDKECWIDDDEDDDEEDFVDEPPKTVIEYTQRMIPSRRAAPPPMSQHSSSRELYPQSTSHANFNSKAPASIMRNPSTRGVGVVPPSASLLMTSQFNSSRGLQQTPPTNSTLLSSSRTSLRSSHQQAPQAGTMLSTSYASMRSSYAHTQPRTQSSMQVATPAPPAPVSTRPSVSRRRGVSTNSILSLATPPTSTYVPLRQRSKTTSSRRGLPPSIGALSSLAHGPDVFVLDPSRFYRIEWTTGEFAFSFQRVYGPSDNSDPLVAPPMFLRMLLNTERGTCPNFARVHVGDVLVQIGTTRVCDLGVDSSSALTKLFAHLQRQMPMPLVFQRMDADEWEGGVEL